MSSRERVLARVAGAVVRGPDHPGPYEATRESAADSTADAAWSRFASMLQRVGGEAVGPVPAAELCAVLGPRIRAWADGGRAVVSGPRALERLAPLGLRAVVADTPAADLADVRVALLEGRLGVEENGAVAIDGECAPQRALPFLCEHLVLLLRADAIVPHLHAAFERLPADATSAHHLTLVSGPSKTADIEQALVYGAHGPRATTVVGILV